MPADRDDLLQPFSMPEPTCLKRVLEGAGFDNIEIRHEIHTSHFSSFEDYWDPVEAGGGRLGQAYLKLPTKKRSAVRKRVREWLSPYADGAAFNTPLEAYLAIGEV